mmetsp:Transcript_9901/g.32736  ORF Transcript_9901/g.32736 Transcript_9901/m.32736 type:complete len:103 (+) Transcript_9901:1017-1325(+)
MHSKNKFVLDPTVYGNAARLFNHCCEPNVTTLGVHNEREKNDETIHNVCNDKQMRSFPTSRACRDSGCSPCATCRPARCWSSNTPRDARKTSCKRSRLACAG